MRYSLLALLLTPILITGCQTTPKVYKYVEVTEMQSPVGGIETDYKPEQVIEAESDSAAYLEGFKKFCIAMRVAAEIKVKTGTLIAKPVRFKLMNETGTDLVPTLTFQGKDEREQEIINSVFKK